MAKSRDNRPAPRDERLTIPLDEQTMKEATAKAGSRSKLVSILRIFIGLWAADEYPPHEVGEWYDDEDIRQDQRRAKKRSRDDD